EKGIVYAPTGSPAYDHNGFNRHGDNLFGNSVVALDARTGTYRWHFQTVHHDLWDYDLASPPNLGTITYEGQEREALVQVTKMGHLFVLDRETGEPIFPIEERPVPQSTIPGEQTAPTQPFPTLPPPYAMQGFEETDITDLSPEAAEYVRSTYFEKYGPSVLFEPLSTAGDFIVPQFNGGTDWGGAAFDKETGILYVNASNEPEGLKMFEVEAGAEHPYKWDASGHDELYDPEGFPISKRPWGTLNAIDLNIGSLLWQQTLGTYPELEKRGLAPTGTFNIGGPIVTKGGLVFIAATKDERFRAFDKRSGKVLWEYQMPAAGYATPATYKVNGKQYVVIAAGGGGKPGTKRGDSYLAFTLAE
ncbi:MAG: PQQ-binding-like beta-propeller repeat protein, partial [Bacteroidota bacterium]